MSVESIHKKLKGKIETRGKTKVLGRKDLSLVYTPGVAKISKLLHKNPSRANEYTIKSNSVAVVSDGSAVLGLGNIGPYGALPVMEGKALLFKKFANIDAFPIVLDTQDDDKIVEIICAIAPVFGGINLEDISAPRCFEIEKRVQERLKIPVFHDDQHATAIVVLAGLINSLKIVKKKEKYIKLLLLGAGAAGFATAKLLSKYGVKNIIVVDRKGAIYEKRTTLNTHKKKIAEITNSRNHKGSLKNVIKGADVFIGLSGPGLVTYEMIMSMNEKAVVFALSNPVPEIMPKEAKKAGAYIYASGRSDFKNQINNALVFPGLFRGAIDNKVNRITDSMKITAAKNIASIVRKPTPSYIIPSLFNKKIVKAVAKAIA